MGQEYDIKASAFKILYFQKIYITLNHGLRIMKRGKEFMRSYGGRYRVRNREYGAGSRKVKALVGKALFVDSLPSAL